MEDDHGEPVEGMVVVGLVRVIARRLFHNRWSVIGQLTNVRYVGHIEQFYDIQSFNIEQHDPG